MIRTLDFIDARRGLLLAAGLLLGLALALAAACDGDDDIEPTATEPEATAEGETRTPDVSSGVPSETGEAPVYWRTLDRFESLQAGEPYKVVLRVTSGYDEETLLVVAELERGGDAVEFVANRAEPTEEEGPGTFYVFALELLEPGAWQVTAMAGEDQVTITVQAQPPGP